MSIKYRLMAYQELFKRYRSVFQHFWKERKSLGGGLFNEEEAEFLPAALSLQEKPVSSTARLTGWLLIMMMGLLLLWSVFGQLDVIVNAGGKIIPSARTKTIAAVEVAAVRSLYVVEGQTVKSGELLIELDSSATDAERDKAAGTVIEAQLQVARSRELIAAVDKLKPPQLLRIKGMESVPQKAWEAAEQHLAGQYRDFRAKLTRIDGEIERASEALPLAAARASDYQALTKNHDVSTHAWQEKEQARIDLSGQLLDAKNQRAALIAQTRKEALDALSEGAKLAAGSAQDAQRAGEHSKLLKLTAPVNGTVQQLTVHTIGGVVPAAQPLMQIVPQENQVEVESFMENRDIGFVVEGQRAEVKIDAFDYTRYGTVSARVTHVSRDAIQDEKKGLLYSVKIMLDRTSLAVDGKLLPLSAGMSVNVEIKTGTRRIIQYALSPFIQHQREALHER